MTTPRLSDVKLIGPNLCEVTVGESRRVYLTSRRALGIALLQEHAANEADSSAASNVVWTDMLATHGVAVGVAGRERITVAVIPETKRTVSWTGTLFTHATDAVGRPASARTLEVTFPPCVLMLRITGMQYTKGTLSCVKPDALKTLSVHSDARVLTPFPYGNVYPSGSRICWGTVAHATLNTAEAVLETFFQSGFNNDLFDTGTYGSVRVRNLPEMLQLPVFPPPTPAQFAVSLATQVQTVLGAAT